MRLVPVLVTPVLALLLVPVAQPQQTEPAVKGESAQSDQRLFQDDIHVKPRGLNLVGAYWTCGARNVPCERGNRKRLRDDLFERLSILESGGNELDGMKFTLERWYGDIEISVERENSSFVWKADGQPLKAKGYNPCKHDDPNKSCKNDGIPGSWMD